MSKHAFPTAEEYESSGMTLRDYFATHAPADVPVWFVDSFVDPVTVPPVIEVRPPGLAAAGMEKFDQWKGWGDYLDDDEIKPEWLAEFKAHADAVEQRDDEINAAKGANDLALRAAWAYAWADALLEARKPAPIPAGNRTVTF